MATARIETCHSKAQAHSLEFYMNRGFMLVNNKIELKRSVNPTAASSHGAAERRCQKTCARYPKREVIGTVGTAEASGMYYAIGCKWAASQH